MQNAPKGSLLIANPFLQDPNFSRTVALLCNHDEEGAFGFVLNRALEIPLGEIVPALKGSEFPVCVGGPVQVDSLHFLHAIPDLIQDGEEIIPGVFYGGNFDMLKIHLFNGDIPKSKIRFFIGYSGWSSNQLETEITEESWITTIATPHLLFDIDSSQTWEECLRTMGGEYKKMINFPIDPQLN